MILIDTSVLSLALRRRDPARRSSAERAIVAAFVELSDQGCAVLIGAIRQEVLSGLRHADQFGRIRRVLDGYDYAETTLSEHDLAAECHNACSSAGVAAGAIDMLICATAIRQDIPIFTTDPDFTRYATRLPLRLHAPDP